MVTILQFVLRLFNDASISKMICVGYPTGRARSIYSS